MREASASVECTRKPHPHRLSPYVEDDLEVEGLQAEVAMVEVPLKERSPAVAFGAYNHSPPLSGDHVAVIRESTPQ